MPKELYKLEDVIDLDKFQTIQDDIARATEMAILTVDFKGVPFTGHSRCQEHCRRIREISHYRDLCQKCDSRGGIEAARSQKPYVYICHRGLVDLAIPIVVRGQYVGAMMAGQVQLDTSHDALEIIASDTSKWLQQATVEERALDQTLRDLQSQLPCMTLDKIEAIASMLSHVCTFVVENALLRDSLSTSAGGESASSVDKRVHTAKDDIIQPALDYLSSHIGEDIYIEKMAKLCGVSVSYFSKCFNHSTGMNFAGYVNHLKLGHAKLQLESNNIAINTLSDNLGFDSPGYFIKQFKAKFGVTPAQYRQQYQAKQGVEVRKG